MQLSPDTVRGILSRWMDEGIVTDYCSDYGEPGYGHSATLGDDATPLVVLGNYWCRCDKVREAEGRPRAGQPALHDHTHHHPRLWQQLEDQGVQFEWCDEWLVDSEHDKAYRCQPDSYSWQPSYMMTDDGELLTPDDDIGAWLEWATNDTSRCIPSRVWSSRDLIGAGFEQYNGKFENGWHPGQDDNPRDIDAAVRRWHGPDVEVVFLLDGTGQFDITFSAYYRGGADALADLDDVD